MRMLKKTLAFLLVVVMVFSCVGTAAAADKKGVSSTKTSGVSVSKAEKPSELKGFKSETFQKQNTYQYADDEVVRAIVVMDGAATIDVADNGSTKAVANDAKLAKQHQGLKSAMNSAGIAYTVNFEYTTLLNGMSVSVAYGDLEAISEMDGVEAVYIANSYSTPVVEAQTKNAYANEMTGAAILQDAGYSGEGIVVAVLDTGLNTTHEAFQDYGKTEAVVTEATVAATTTNAAGKYLSEKVPFAYDYADGDADVTDHNGHGTHVAGSAVGYVEEEDGAVTFSGAAPAAQLLAMKIFFDEQSGTSSDVYFAAIEDAYLLGADVISMSIGAQNGFTYDAELEDVVFGNIYEKMEDEGVIMSIAAGNEYSMGEYSYNWYTASTGSGSVLADYADYGVVGSPSTYLGNTSIAAVENVAYPQPTITVAGEAYGYTDSSDNGDVCKDLEGQELAFVMVPNYGAAEDYEGLDVTGKVAVVSRGDITFVEKMENAAAAGAIAIVVYNNQPGTIAMAIDDYVIPAVSVLQSTGEALAECAAASGEEKICYAKQFTDVNTSRWYHEAVDWAVANNLIKGITNTTFAPNAELTRGQMVTILYRAAGEPELEEDATTPFTDVDSARFYAKAVTWAYNEEIVKGMTDTTFEPNTSVTREQLVTILYRADGSPEVEEDYLADYTDKDSVSKFAKAAVNWAVSMGMINSTSTTAKVLSPKDCATRAQFARILMEYLGGSYKCGITEAVLTFDAEPSVFENDKAWLMCDFSSWGTTSDLRFKPMLTSVGGNVYSASMRGDDAYELMSGTSMATPNASGNFAQLLQYVAEQYPDLSRSDRAQMVKDLAESTADILADNDYNVYSPRKQGAGLLDVYSAVTADSYVKSPLIELGDDAEKTGVYTMSFEVENLSDKSVSYEVDPWVLVDSAADYSDTEYSDFDNYSKYNLLTSAFAGYDYTTNCEDDILTLAAGETKTVEVTVTLDEDTIAYLNEMFDNGAFVEGYAILWELDDEGELTYDYIHASFLAFYGDWTDAPILTEYDFADAIDAYDFIYNYDLAALDASLAGKYPYQYGYTINDVMESDIGFNEAYLYGAYSGLVDLVGGSVLFYNEQNDAYNAISNAGGDGYYDADTVMTFPTQLRNARHLIMTVTNSETGELYYVDDTEYLPKAYYESDYGVYLQQGSFYWDGVNYMTSTDENIEYVENNTKVTFNYYANLDYGEDELGAIDYENLAAEGQDYLEWSFDVMVDNEAPVISGVDYDETTGKLTVAVSDNYYMATVYACDEDYNLIDAVLCDAEPNEAGEYVLDLSRFTGDAFYLFAQDYATNYDGGVVTLGDDEDPTVDGDLYLWVDEVTDDMSGEYVITGYKSTTDTYDTYLLDASGDLTGTAIGSADAPVNIADVGVEEVYDFDDDYNVYYYLTGVTDDQVYVFEKTDDGNYTIRMKGSDNYLAYTGDGKNALTTTTDPTSTYAQWKLVTTTEDEEVEYGDGTTETVTYAYTNIYNVGASDRALLYNVSAGMFRCYTKTYNGTDYQSYNLDLYRKVDLD